jgi:hypothetical protein
MLSTRSPGEDARHSGHARMANVLRRRYEQCRPTLCLGWADRRRHRRLRVGIRSDPFFPIKTLCHRNPEERERSRQRYRDQTSTPPEGENCSATERQADHSTRTDRKVLQLLGASATRWM